MVSVRLRHGHLPAKGQRVTRHNPAAEKRLHRHTLSVSEVEAVLELPDLATPVGLRNRAMFETLCSYRSQENTRRIENQGRSGGSEGGRHAEREDEGAE
jgi:hypothetical protein